MSEVRYVLDSSAILAWLYREPGDVTVANYIANENCLMSTVNLAEVITKLADDKSAYAETICDQLVSLGINMEVFSEAQAIHAGFLRSITRSAGLSLGDRACLALALDKNAVVLTTDRIWLTLGLPVEIINIREQS